MGSFDSTQLKALKEYLPNAEEKRGLEGYMTKAGGDEEKKQALYSDLSECEKYMHTMISVSKAAEKFDCMIFRSQFQSRYDELMDSMKLIETACDEIRNSDRLREVMTLILVLVNEINTGGEAKGAAAGFSLEALLKLNEVRPYRLVRRTVFAYFSHFHFHSGKSIRQEDNCSPLPREAHHAQRRVVTSF